MKVKSLLFAAAAMLAMGANAQYAEWTGSLTIPAEDAADIKAGETLSTTLILDLGNMENFTNFECHFAHPAGVVVDFADVTDDTKAKNDKGRTVQALSWATNEKSEEESVIFASNGNKVPILKETKNPIELCYIDFAIAADFVGAVELFQCKAVNYEGETFEMPRATLFKVGNETAVNDVNVNKAVASVKYYNAAGVAADKAFDGVNIVVTKYADGSQSVSKVVK